MVNLIIIFLAKYLIFISLSVTGVFFLLQNRPTKKQMFYYALIIFPLSYLIAYTTSKFYNNPRPFVVGNFTPLVAHGPDNGFPSDHTLLAASLAFFILPFNKKLAAILLGSAILVGTGRVLGEVHHVIDVLGSLIICAVVGLSTYKLVRKDCKPNLQTPNNPL